LKRWVKISAAVILTAMICVPVMATVMGSGSVSLNVAGSTTVQPLMVELQKEFEKFADVEMNVTGGGSGTGISATLNGVADIGMLSRDLKESEKNGLTAHVIAKDAVVIIINASANIGSDPDIPLEDLAKIYSGEYTKWNDGTLGGSDQSIAVIAREEGSGTRDCFETALKKADPSFNMKEKGVNSVNSTGAVLLAVNDTPGAIGYINMNVSDGIMGNTQTVKVDGEEATKMTVLSGDYHISRDLLLVTKGDVTDGMPIFFIDWVLSRDGQDIVENAGFVRIDGR